jgi:hypothetical protein
MREKEKERERDLRERERESMHAKTTEKKINKNRGGLTSKMTIPMHDADDESRSEWEPLAAPARVAQRPRIRAQMMNAVLYAPKARAQRVRVNLVLSLSLSLSGPASLLH